MNCVRYSRLDLWSGSIAPQFPKLNGAPARVATLYRYGLPGGLLSAIVIPSMGVLGF
jgi:hypothetical protein